MTGPPPWWGRVQFHRARRLGQAFLHNLLSWQRSGFSVWAEQVVRPDLPAAPRFARILSRRPPVPLPAG